MKKVLIFLLIVLSNLCYSKININTANLKELIQLKGIGKHKALKIICYRQKNGNFSYIEDITKVKGISYKIFDKIKQDISVYDEYGFSNNNNVIKSKKCKNL